MSPLIKDALLKTSKRLMSMPEIDFKQKLALHREGSIATAMLQTQEFFKSLKITK